MVISCSISFHCVEVYNQLSTIKWVQNSKYSSNWLPIFLGEYMKTLSSKSLPPFTTGSGDLRRNPMAHLAHLVQGRCSWGFGSPRWSLRRGSAHGWGTNLRGKLCSKWILDGIEVSLIIWRIYVMCAVILNQKNTGQKLRMPLEIWNDNVDTG